MDSSDFHRKIMNLRSPNDETGDYKKGHRDARHAAAEIANDADARIAELETVIDTQEQHICQVDPLRERVRKLEAALKDLRNDRIAELETIIANAPNPYTGITLDTDAGVFVVAKRDRGIEVMLGGKLICSIQDKGAVETFSD